MASNQTILCASAMATIAPQDRAFYIDVSIMATAKPCWYQADAGCFAKPA